MKFIKKIKKAFKKNKANKKLAHFLRMLVFVFAAATMTIKFAEVSANETVGLLIENPDIAEYSYLVKYGYLVIK